MRRLMHRRYTAAATTPNRAGDTAAEFIDQYVRINAMNEEGDLNETWDAADYPEHVAIGTSSTDSDHWWK